jgi:hypothetical protein
MAASDTKPVLTARAEIDTPRQQAKRWFLELSDHPERYEFESHEGFTFTDGAFGEVGAKFQTLERFLGVSQILRFTLTNVTDYQFTFRLRQPITGIWGRFVLSEISPDTTELRLEIGGETKLKRLVLMMPVVSQAIRSQIQSEVDHIKASIDRTTE